jgi:hypothetical protein
VPISTGMAVDRRLLGHWNREQAARRHSRHTLPLAWQNDTRPEMRAVIDVYVEMLARIKEQKQLYALTDDDR